MTPNTKEKIPKEKKVEKKDRLRKEMITVELKKEIIEKHERGMRITDIARFYKKATSTICTILKKKEIIRKLQSAKGVSRISKQRPPVLDDIEKLLLVWINCKQLAGDTVTEKLICETAKSLYTDIVSNLPSTSTEHKTDFKASRGWFDRFKRRSGIHCVIKQEDGENSDAKVAEGFVIEFNNLMTSESYLPQQVFNCDETELYWKKMPKRTYITTEENAMPNYEPSMQERLSLLFCANASGDLKIKPLLVYHTENPRAFKRCKVEKSQLSVMWRANNKASVTHALFVEWMNEVFGPTVKSYLLENKFPLKTLLVMDKAAPHSPDLESDLLEEFRFIKVKFFPANITPLLQPMDQQIISTFKKLYTKILFQRCFEVTDGTDLSLREFWKNHFQIVNCLDIIDKAWNTVSRSTLNSAWKNLWPACVNRLIHEHEPLISDEIVSLGKIMGLEVNEDDIEELVAEYHHELTTDELMEMYYEQQEIKSEVEEEEEQELLGKVEVEMQMPMADPTPEVMPVSESIPETISKSELIPEIEFKSEPMTETISQPESEEYPTTNEIRQMFDIWNNVQFFVEKHHPNKTIAMQTMNIFNDNVMSYFYEILQSRQNQV